VIVIEHNLEVIKTADHVIDLGPEGGDAGGEIIAEGTPEEIANIPFSYTGQFLRKIFARDRARAPLPEDPRGRSIGFITPHPNAGFGSGGKDEFKNASS
jgi:excinuclease ABC subunit A